MLSTGPSLGLRRTDRKALALEILTAPGKDQIPGVTIVGERAADLLAEYVLAMGHGLG